jgi:hypothetical protein
MAPPPPDQRTGRDPRGTPSEAYRPPWRGYGRPGGG